MSQASAAGLQQPVMVRSVLRFVGWLGAIVVAIGAARDFARRLDWLEGGVLAALSLEGEDSLIAWYTAAVLALVGLAMLWVASAGRRTSTPILTTGWIVLGLGFLYLAIDEASGDLHEHFGDWLLWVPSPFGIFEFRWVIVGFPLAAIVAVLFLPMLLRLPRDTARRLVVAGAIYVVGALAFEMVGGMIYAAHGRTIGYTLAVIAEESLEILGAILALRCVLLHRISMRGAALP